MVNIRLGEMPESCGATIMPATQPIAPAMPHPSVSMWPVLIPMSWLACGLSAAARMPSPSFVRWKK